MSCAAVLLVRLPPPLPVLHPGKRGGYKAEGVSTRLCSPLLERRASEWSLSSRRLLARRGLGCSVCDAPVPSCHSRESRPAAQEAFSGQAIARFSNKLAPALDSKTARCWS